ncbi:MAG TPA: tetratricopeptide repeat protein [Candidatus Binatia bacterium]
MKKRFFMLFVVVTLGWTSACATHFSPAYHSFEQGRTLFNQGRFDEAVSYLEDATREDPEFSQAYLYLGRAYISQSRWRAAIQPLRTAFRLSPKESQQEIMNLLVDAMFAAALNDFNLSGEHRPPVRFNSAL